MDLDFTALFVYVDDFCKGFIPFWDKHVIESGLRKRNRGTNFGLSEIISIVIMYRQSHFDCFKHN